MMRQNVPEGDDARRIADPSGCLRVVAAEPIERLADDLEVPNILLDVRGEGRLDLHDGPVV